MAQKRSERRKRSDEGHNMSLQNDIYAPGKGKLGKIWTRQSRQGAHGQCGIVYLPLLYDRIFGG